MSDLNPQSAIRSPRFQRVLVLVLDSVGVGEMPDAAEYGDVGSDTLGNIARARGGLKLPNLGALGLGNIIAVAGVPPAPAPKALFGKAALAAPNKDTTSGHWEMMTAVLSTKLRTYPEGFPEDLIAEFARRAEVPGVLANKVGSGTEVLAEYGDEHVRSGKPIVYTSADSVFQVACHEESFGLERLYHVCHVARELLRGEHEVGRVIARPFTGGSGAYKRTSNRKDLSLEPPVPTVLDRLVEKGVPVFSTVLSRRGSPSSASERSRTSSPAAACRRM